MNQPPKVKNILIRYCHSSHRASGIKCPENSHLLKHFPKYYKDLSIDITCQNPLFSKIKKVKMLKKFTGSLQKKKFVPQNLWFSLFKPHQKEIEKIPDLEGNSFQTSRSYWEKLSVKGIKFFYNITKLHLSSLRINNKTSCQWDSVFRYINNMRRLRNLKIRVEEDNYEEVKGIVGKLEKMERLLTQFERLQLYVDGSNMDIQDLLDNKNFMGSLTSLEFRRDFLKWYPFLGNIPRACKNLRYLSLSFKDFFSENPQFADFLVSIRDLPKLEGVEFHCEKNMKEFLKVFKPQACLRYLNLHLEFPDMDLTTMNFESKDLRRYENLVQHWEDLKQLETLNLYLVCRSNKMMSFIRILVTMILKKTPKLKSFKCWICIGEDIDCIPSSYAPFFIEQVPHLYESLEKFRTLYCDCYPLPSNVSFNLGALKVFKNLKKIRIKGEGLRFVKIRETIELLEKKSCSKLNLKGIAISSKNDLKKILEEISKAKRTENNNVEIKLEFEFQVKPSGEEIKYLKKFCHVIESIKPIKGLLLLLNLLECSEPPIEKIRAVMKQHPHFQNCIIRLYSLMERLVYCRIDGMEGKLSQ